jgi:lysophospholipase L1-like esterase
MKSNSPPLDRWRMNRRPGDGLPRFFGYVGVIVLSLITAAILLEVGSRLALLTYHHFRPATDVAYDNSAYWNYPWARELAEEQSRRVARITDTYFPFRIWGVSEWHGKFMNNDATTYGAVRRTTNATNPACGKQPPTAIWIFGGSTVYGTHIRDSDTMPSLLSRQLNADSLCVEVTNFGVEGYVSNQELLLLIEQLKAGHRPDIVVLYDGYNDAYLGTVLPGDPNSHLGIKSIRARLEGSIAGRLDFLKQSATWQAATTLTKGLRRTRPTRNSGVEPAAQVQAILNNYEENLRIITALAGGYNFKVYAFWQPALAYGRKPLLDYEQRLKINVANGAYDSSNAITLMYEEAERRARRSGNFVFLGNIFDDVQQPLYLDSVHLNVIGNSLVTQVIASYIEHGFLNESPKHGIPSASN